MNRTKRTEEEVRTQIEDLLSTSGFKYFDYTLERYDSNRYYRNANTDKGWNVSLMNDTGEAFEVISFIVDEYEPKVYQYPYWATTEGKRNTLIEELLR